jgi:peptidoglycan/xylan/chitin deacetylase (PgdA/CDA1 family)
VELVAHAEVGDRRLAALTFDDGPSPSTLSILDALARYGARSTFFVMGQAVAGNEGALRRAVREGHELAVHTWSHPRPTDIADDQVRAELERTQKLVQEVAGVEPTLLRPPYGRAALRYARLGVELGLAPTVLWSVDGYDYQDGVRAADIVEFVRTGMRPGAIALLHDGRRADEQTVEALGPILGDLDERGYQAVTVRELLRASISARRA